MLALCLCAPAFAAITRAPIVLNYDALVSTIVARGADQETAVLNLLDNAQRFSPEGVPVTVAVGGPTPEGEVIIRLIDRGPGISPEHAPHIFEPFFTTDAERDGTGLGLAIGKSVVTAHRGTISFWSEPGRGTCFELRLPTGLPRLPAPRTRP